MLIRAKPFLRFLILCVTPLLLLGIFNYWISVRATGDTVRRNLTAGLKNFRDILDHSVKTHEDQLVNLGRSEALQKYLKARHGEISVDSSGELQVGLASVINSRSRFSNVAAFNQKQQRLFVAESQPAGKELSFRDRDFLSAEAQPDDRLWTAAPNTIVRSPIRVTPEGTTLRLGVPVISGDQKLGVLVADLRLDSLFEDAAENWTAEQQTGAAGSRAVIVLDNKSRKILYHPNHALLHQSVDDSMPYFAPIAQQMISGQDGIKNFTMPTQNETQAAFTTLPALNLSAALTDDYFLAMAASRRAGWMSIFACLILGVLAAIFMTRYWERKRRGIERVKKGVAAIAQGELDHRIDVQSSVDIRPLADDVNLLTAQLREQLAREAEARQFQSFVRLSAMLTHDLKNAIEALSLIVGNMERHFDNQAFRVDAMRSLNLATQNLRSLVSRLSNPVTTLSGEHKRPQPVDLVPLLKRALALTVESSRVAHQIQIELPDSLFALVDTERIEKVIENLLLNALEAMGDKEGKLTITGGQAPQGQVFFKVSDSGIGMSDIFIQNHLYRPFATTKKRGVGLGLYTCREVVRANGGAIEVESKEGAGTTFTVVLPSSS